jgi:hypothetical protein
MSSLETSLLLLAAVAIVAVLGYNVWLGRTRSAGAKAQASAPAAAEPARGEPSLVAGASDASAAAASDAFAGGSPPPAGRAGAALLNELTDCIVELGLPAPVAGERLFQLTLALRRAGSKPVGVEGLPWRGAGRTGAAAGDAGEAAEAPGAGDDTAGARGDAAALPGWEVLQPGVLYGDLRIGVLLANRHGPLNAMEFSEFVAAIQSLADQLSVLADTPDMTAVLERARALDDACAQLDAQVGLGVEAPDALGVADLARLAAECACAERGNNRYARLGPSGEVLFSLALADAPNRLSLLLDVARAPAGSEPWREMAASAQLCAQRLGGVVVDDAGRPLAAVHLERIDQQIAQRQQSLADAGFEPGSPLALRVFN